MYCVFHLCRAFNEAVGCLAELSPCTTRKFGVLPKARTACELPAELPVHLGELLHLQPAFLRQLTLVKLRIVARAFQGVHTDDKAVHSEGALIDLMQAAIKVGPRPSCRWHESSWHGCAVRGHPASL